MRTNSHDHETKKKNPIKLPCCLMDCCGGNQHTLRVRHLCRSFFCTLLFFSSLTTNDAVRQVCEPCFVPFETVPSKAGGTVSALSRPLFERYRHYGISPPRFSHPWIVLNSSGSGNCLGLTRDYLRLRPNCSRPHAVLASSHVRQKEPQEYR